MGAALAKEDIVLVDHRTYRIKPGMTQAHLEIYEKYGFAASARRRYSCDCSDLPAARAIIPA